MRRLLLATSMVLSAALFGCGGGNSVVPANNPDNAGQGNGSYEQMLDELAKAPAPAGYFEIVDAETGALVSRSDMTVNSDGSYGLDPRGGQDITYGPVQNQVFRVAITIEEDGPNAPAGYSGGNALYYIGQNVEYDVQVTRRFPENGMLEFYLGDFDLEVTHEMSNNQAFPECVAGQNPLIISNVDFWTQTPDNGPADPYVWSPDGKTFLVKDNLFKLCNLPGVVYGTDKICVKIWWVISGADFGLPCSSCEIRCVVFDQCIGVYDPPE